MKTHLSLVLKPWEDVSELIELIIELIIGLIWPRCPMVTPESLSLSVLIIIFSRVCQVPTFHCLF